jgi:hypothetical protein
MVYGGEIGCEEVEKRSHLQHHKIIASRQTMIELITDSILTTIHFWKFVLIWCLLFSRLKLCGFGHPAFSSELSLAWNGGEPPRTQIKKLGNNEGLS